MYFSIVSLKAHLQVCLCSYFSHIIYKMGLLGETLKFKEEITILIVLISILWSSEQNLRHKYCYSFTIDLLQLTLSKFCICSLFVNQDSLS